MIDSIPSKSPADKKQSIPPPPFFLLLVPVFFYLHNLSEFLDLILNKEVFLFLGIWLMLPFLFYYILALIIKTTYHVRIILTIYGTCFFFFFGVVQDFLHRHHVEFLSKSLVLLPLFLIVGCAIVYLCDTEKVRAARLILYCKILFTLFVLSECLMISIKTISAKTYSATTARFISPLPVIPLPGKDQPDIYHVVFDEYASSAMLKSHCQYFNPIDSFLSGKGFLVSGHSLSNYNFTPFSMASTFDMQYLQHADQYLEINAKNFYIGMLAFKKNILFRLLHDLGYSIQTYSLLQSDSLLNKLGVFGPQKPLSWLRYQTLERWYLNSWLLEKLFSHFRRPQSPPAAIEKNLRDYVGYNAKALDYILGVNKSQSKTSGNPVFCYTHFLLPHGPFVFDANGKVHIDHPINDIDGYLAQVKYSNKLIKKIVGELLSDSSRNKVIIIQGDHGFRQFPAPTQPEDQYRNFSAIYFYNHQYHPTDTNISLVNTYRIVLNTFFKTDLPLLTDTIVINRKEASGK